MMNFDVALCLLIYCLSSLLIAWKAFGVFRNLLEYQKEIIGDSQGVVLDEDLPENVILFKPYNVFKELLIEFLEVEKKTDMQTYAVTRSRVLRKAKRLLDME